MNESGQFALDFTQKLPPAVQERIAEGMAQADANAEVDWKYVWDACVLAAARRLPRLTSDDVLAEFEQLRKQPYVHNLSAIGPAMKRAWKMGIIAPTDEIVRSERPEKRGNYHRTWVSNYYEAKQ